MKVIQPMPRMILVLENVLAKEPKVHQNHQNENHLEKGENVHKSASLNICNIAVADCRGI